MLASNVRRFYPHWGVKILNYSVDRKQNGVVYAEYVSNKIFCIHTRTFDTYDGRQLLMQENLELKTKYGPGVCSFMTL